MQQQPRYMKWQSTVSSKKKKKKSLSLPVTKDNKRQSDTNSLKSKRTNFLHLNTVHIVK